MQHVVPFAPVPMPADIATTIITDEFIDAVAGADAPADELQDGGEFTVEGLAGFTAHTGDASDAEAEVAVAVAVPARCECDRAELTKAVAAALRAIERRNTIPILANVLLRAGDGGIEVIGTDLDIVVTVKVAAEVDSHFAVTVPAHMLHDMLRKSPADNVVLKYEGDRAALVVLLGQNRNTLQALPPTDFPELQLRASTAIFELPADVFLGAFARVAFAISTEETRYYLNGAYLHAPHGADGMLRLVATDGHRLGQSEIATDIVGSMPGVIVPRKTIDVMRKIIDCKKPARKHAAGWYMPVVTCEVGPTSFLVESGNVRLYSKVIDGTFPDYGRVIPLGNDKELKVDKKDFEAAVDRVSTVSSERGRAVKLSLSGPRLLLSVTNPDSGSATEELEVDYGGDPLDIGFNSQYLLAILAQFAGGTVTMKLADPGSPTLFVDHGTNGRDGVLYVLMPMRV